MISAEARIECQRDPQCLKQAHAFCQNYCRRFPEADKCSTHCCTSQYVCRYGRCRYECTTPVTEREPLPSAADLRIAYKRDIPLLVHKNPRSWKFNAMPINQFMYGLITGTSVDSMWAQGDTLQVVPQYD